MRRRTRVLVAAGALGALWLLAAAYLLVGAARDLRAGTAAMEGARAGNGLSEVADGRPLPHLRTAERRFARAEARTTSPVLLPVRLVPVLGRQLRSVAALSSAARDVAGTALDAMTRSRQLLEPPRGSNPERVELVRSLGGLAGDTHDRLAAIGLGPADGLFAPLARARNRLGDELAKVQDELGRASTAATGVAEMLTGPRRYLVFAANNAEMRAGSGMFLSVGELEIDDGGLHLGEMRSVVDVPVPGGVAISADLADRWGWLAPNREWRNLMASPRFDATAELAARMWVAAGNRPVDGVLALDPVALEGVLAATGPVTVDGRSVDAEDVVDELLHGQYLRFPERDRSVRREELGRIARGAFDALDAGRWSVSGLAGGLRRAASGRHLLAWSAKPAQQAGWEALGVDGALDADSLLVSVLNRGSNKLDQFLAVTADIDVDRTAAGTDVSLSVTLRNTVPAGEPPYVAGEDPASGVPSGSYLGILTVNLPGAATGGRIDGVTSLAVAGPDGPTRVVGHQLRVDPGQARTLVVRFTLPPGATGLRVEPSARVPAIAWTGAGGSSTGESGRDVALVMP
jgi:hypothetical protein